MFKNNPKAKEGISLISQGTIMTPGRQTDLKLFALSFPDNLCSMVITG